MFYTIHSVLRFCACKSHCVRKGECNDVCEKCKGKKKIKNVVTTKREYLNQL